MKNQKTTVPPVTEDDRAADLERHIERVGSISVGLSALAELNVLAEAEINAEQLQPFQGALWAIVRELSEELSQVHDAIARAVAGRP